MRRWATTSTRPWTATRLQPWTARPQMSIATRPLPRPWTAAAVTTSNANSHPLMTLAIETSCDDTSVAVVETGDLHGATVARIHFHDKVTADNTAFGGVHPLATLKSHQEQLAALVTRAIAALPAFNRLRYNVHVAPRPSARIIHPKRPDFISVTRGPGMRANLSVGLDTAKGLAAAWRVPLVGVHHMQAHALTPRLLAALAAYDKYASPADATCALVTAAYRNATSRRYAQPPLNLPKHRVSAKRQLASEVRNKEIYMFRTLHLAKPFVPDFPLLSLLASGGHTLIVASASLTDHAILGSTLDTAIGDCLDKAARLILPPDLLEQSTTTMYGALLETFAFPPRVHGAIPPGSKGELTGLTGATYLAEHGYVHEWYTPPANHEIAHARSKSKWGWNITQPLSRAAGGTKLNTMDMSFSGLLTSVERFIRFPTDPATGKFSSEPRSPEDISLDERRDMARDLMTAAFEHITSRLLLALEKTTPETRPAVVLSGGVASNTFLRHVLASFMCARGFGDVELFFPPPTYCTDNAAMIAWTGLEMFQAGHTDPSTIRAVRKWPLDELMTPVVDDKI